MSSKVIEHHKLRTAAQKEAALEVLSKIEKEGIQMIRLSWPDQYGLLRGKMLSVSALKSAFTSGSEITMAPFFFDTASAIVFNPFQPGGAFGDAELSGSPNVVMVPDPTTFRILPWADRSELTRIVDPCLNPATLGDPGTPAKVMPLAKG